MKRKREKREPPVPTNHDDRCEEPSNNGSGLGREPKAPDGISGDWG